MQHHHSSTSRAERPIPPERRLRVAEVPKTTSMTPPDSADQPLPYTLSTAVEPSEAERSFAYRALKYRAGLYHV